MGFYTTRWTQASNPDSAEVRVIERMRLEPELQKPEGFPGALEAKVFVEKIEKLKLPPLRRPAGFSWFEMGDAE